MYFPKIQIQQSTTLIQKYLITQPKPKIMKNEQPANNPKLAGLYLQKQFQLLKKCEEELQLSVGLVDENLFQWRLCFTGPEGTPFEGGLYQATLSFPQNFPNMPPKMHFKTQMFHPNIYPNGDVCISILHPPFHDPMNPQERLDEKWNPVLTMQAVIISVTSMLLDPNLDSPANVDAAKMYKQKRGEYNSKLRKLAEKSMNCF